VDGPLVLEVRYPTEQAVAVADSISVWGTVGSGQARLRINGRPVPVEANGGFATFLPLPSGDPPVLDLEASKGGDTLRRALTITRTRSVVAPTQTPRPAIGWVRLRRLPDDTLDAPTLARPVYARWTPGGALALPLPLGAVVPIDRETDGAVRVRLARGVAPWINRIDTEPTRPPRIVPTPLDGPTLVQDGIRSVIGVNLPDLLPSTVDVVGNHLRWTLFGAQAGKMRPVESADGLVRKLVVRDRGDGRVQVEVTLAAAPLGWRTTWREGKATLELRPLRTARPGLEGLVIALDPGHPPGGATGPTGLTEDSVNLAVALETATRLRALGARPFLTRSTPDPVSLDARPVLAEAADAELFVSIHANSPGDGRPPESVAGTRIFWWYPQALPLAKALRDSVARATGQLRMGTVHSDLSVLRSTWFPAVLIEVTAIVTPAGEAWLRSPEGISSQADGIIGGIRAWQAGRFVAEGTAVEGRR